MRWLNFAVLVLLIAGPASALADSGAAPQTVRQFIDSLGVIGRVGPDSCRDGYACDAGELLREMRFLGLHHMRVQDDNHSAIEHLRVLCSGGIKLDVLHHLSPDMSDEIALGPACIQFVEGRNEINNRCDGHCVFNYRGLSDIAAATRLQKDLFSASRAWNARTPVLTYSESVGADQAGEDVSAFSDLDNVHNYVGNGEPPADGAFYIKKQTDLEAPGRPFVITENGYSAVTVTPPAFGLGTVSEEVQAILDLDVFLDTIHVGAVKTYLYELSDNAPSDSNYCKPTGGVEPECHYGVFAYATGVAHARAKPAAIAIHNLTTILADQGGRAAAAKILPVTWTGLLSDQLTEQLTASDGSQWLIVHDESKGSRQLWDVFNQKGRHNTNTVTATMPDSHEFEIYDPVIGPQMQAGMTGKQVVAVLGYHPLFIHIRP